MVLSPEHALVASLVTPGQADVVAAYQREVSKKSDLERTELAKEKSGVFTGAFATNPVNGQRIPIWIADYVLASYGTGAIMAVPAHDDRDFEFATKFHLPIVEVVASASNLAAARPAGPLTQAMTEEGAAIHSENSEMSLNGLGTHDAKRRITVWLESKGLGKKTTHYKLRDWLFSRQRYWGEPFPLVWKNGQSEALPESDLPVIPPPLEDYKPTPDGQPPLARAADWVRLSNGATRELNTMPQWAGSCWYYLRYLDAKNSNRFVGQEAEAYWMGSGGEAPARQTTPGVDLYVGGTEHAVLHLLYARFWHKVLFDLGHVSTPEPFFKLVNQGLILGGDGQKMSKSRGNVVNPDDILGDYGADAFRLYEMFMGPLQETKPWNTQGVEGVYRFLGRLWRLLIDEASETEFELAATTSGADQHAKLLGLLRLSPKVQNVAPSPAQLKTLHTCIKKVTEDLDGMRFNTAISAMMVFVNEAMNWQVRPVTIFQSFLQLLAPLAPHFAEELWERLHQHLGEKVSSLGYAPWPQFDPAWLVEATIEVPVQVNGKLRGRITMATGAAPADLEREALTCEPVAAFLDGKTVKKVIVVSGKLVNIVVS